MTDHADFTRTVRAMSAEWDRVPAQRDTPEGPVDELVRRLAQTFADECQHCRGLSAGWVAHRDDAEALLSAVSERMTG